MAADRRKQIEGAIAALGSLRGAVASEQSRILDEVVALLASLDGELASMSAKLRWHASAPFRSKKDEAPEGQLAFELLRMLAGRLGQEPAADGVQPSEGDAQPSEADKPTEGDKPADENPPGGRGSRPNRERRGRGLRRKIENVKVEESEVPKCPCCSKQLGEMGFDVRERFIYKPAEVYILEERIYKYGCRCGEVVVTAEPTEPPKPIPGGMASSSLLAQLSIGKVLDGNPVERFAKQLRRQDIDLATSTLNDWVGRVGDMFAFVRSACHRQLLTCGLISLDDTPVRARNAEHPAHVQTGRQWLYLGDINQIAYAEFTPDWKGTHPRRVLEGFSGDIQNDGYAGINPLFVGPDAPRRLGCNDHGRRRFVQALEQGDRRAQPMIDLYSALYHVERTATERNLGAIGRHALRQAESVPLWREFGRMIIDITPKVDKKAPLGKAIHYWTRQQPALRAFLDDGRFPISNAHVERLLRVVSTFRKNSLFVGSLDAGERYANLLTVLLNCELAGVNPYVYLVDVIDKIAADWPAGRVAELLPRAWLAARQAEEQPPGQAGVVAVT
ncbi:MAG: IS66 family transposase [Burkholderiales bacterium]